MLNRRQFIAQAGLLASALSFSSRPVFAGLGAQEMLMRKIPGSGEVVPIIGMGTSGSFEVPRGSEEYNKLSEVLEVFFAGGGRLIDTAPTYGNAEDVLGDLLTHEQRKLVFLATKLSDVSGKAAGRAQFEKTLKRLRMDKVDLLQVHNLNDTDMQLSLARELREEGKVRYIGVTHYIDRAHDQVSGVVEKYRPDFLQINYSVMSTGAEDRIFPVAQEHGVAVLTNSNFKDGRLFQLVADQQLPAWASEVGATSWAQLFLKFALSHPAVTAVLPATGKPHRSEDNLGAGRGPLLNEQERAALKTQLLLLSWKQKLGKYTEGILT